MNESWINAQKETPLGNWNVVVWNNGELAIGWYTKGAWYIRGLHPVDVNVTYWMDIDPPREEKQND